MAFWASSGELYSTILWVQSLDEDEGVSNGPRMARPESLVETTYPQPLELPLGRVRTSEKTTLPAVFA